MPNKNTHFKVKNVNGTSGRKCSCRTWLEHWSNHTDLERVQCAVIPCGNEAEVGAHVIITDRRTSNEWWIVPMCKSHNHHTNDGEMFIDSRTHLVSANVQRSCG